MIKLEVNFKRRNLGTWFHMWNNNKNKFEKIDALFDTGAHTSAIDTDVFFNLGYDLSGAVKSFISTATGSREAVHRVRIEKIMLGDTPFDGVLFNTFDFPWRSYPAIIGMNIIRQFEINMDFKSRLITMRENYIDKDDNYYDSDIFGDWRVYNAD
jgi:predicted aspartyl protease